MLSALCIALFLADVYAGGEVDGLDKLSENGMDQLEQLVLRFLWTSRFQMSDYLIEGGDLVEPTFQVDTWQTCLSECKAKFGVCEFWSFIELNHQNPSEPAN